MTAAQQVQGRPCQALSLGPAAWGWPGLPAAGLDVVLCRPGGLPPVPVSTWGGLPFLPSQALRDGRTPLSAWPGESYEPSAC